VRQPLRMVDGYLQVPTGPGLGVDVKEETIERYRIA
jgi:L-alanine-DL-glutamate epimerase-like enolase superfamily enzyme